MISSDKKELATAGDFLRKGVDQFNNAGLHFGHGTDNAWDEAVVLMLYCLELPGDSGREVLDIELSSEQKEIIENMFERRVEERIPAPYLTGESWFAGLRFTVDERVLIPRSPIAELIENQFSPWLYKDPVQILDLCTGSGCIGIACAYAFPLARVMLSDLSEDALAVARVNIREHGLASRVSANKSDLFDRVSGHFDLIVVNPPYVDADDLAAMPEEFIREPAMALASGPDGLNFTRRLLKEAAALLTESGCLCVEVGNSRCALEADFPEVPFNWVDFERGGHGVFILYREDLIVYADYFV